ncbi:MAG: HAMP domain-containing histidine kinase [Alphaproteobacteria bacterium]|nr:MAG: HAMP domain-containing histidine kinase [Alphaproteobacteria bacterium]
MQIVADLWHPSLLMFLATTALPIFLFKQRPVLREIEQGYSAILYGAVIIAIAAFADYAEELPYVQDFVVYHLGGKAEGTLLPFIYVPGILTVGYGVSRWLPAVYTVSHEIERRKAAEAELLALLQEVNNLARQAEEANRSKSEFLATMSHELRTPLNAVIGFTEMLQTDLYNNPEKRQEYLAIIADSGHHLLNIINDILDLSRLEAGKIPIEVTSFNVGDLIDECIAYTEPRAISKDLKIVRRYPDLDITTDRRLMKQILLNLLSNAVKFTPEHGTISLTADLTGDQVQISVQDTGVGMSPEEVQRAMEPFVQIDNRLARAHEGTGLGLPLVDRFTALLKGSMAINSEKGVGTRVDLKLPADSAITGEPEFI